MLPGIQVAVLIILSIAVLVTALVTEIRKKSAKKSVLSGFTPWAYVLFGMTMTIITLLIISYWQFRRTETISAAEQRFDDTLYSLSKQLTAHNLSYEKKTNRINIRNIVSTGIKQQAQWYADGNEKQQLFLTGNLSFFNNASYSLVNIKGKMYTFCMSGKQFSRLSKGGDLFSEFSLEPGFAQMPIITYALLDTSQNIFYTKVGYEDEDGFSRSPIRQVYLARNAFGVLMQPRLITDHDSLAMVQSFLEKNNIW